MSDQPSKSTDKATVQKIELDELSGSSTEDILFDHNMQLIENVSVKLSVSIGQTNITIKELFDLREGELLSLDKSTNEPVDVLLDGKIVARGELVATGDNFGVRITEIKPGKR